MKSRYPIALALTAMLGATTFVALHANAQQSAPQAADQRAMPRVHGPMGPDGAMRGPMMHMTAEDHAAFLDARIAAVKAGLKLNADQEKLWPAIETAVRDGLTKAVELHRQTVEQGRPTDPIAHLRRMADLASARGDALHKIVDAAQPLFATLTDEQKHRLPLLIHGSPGGHFGAMRERMQGMWNGDDRGPGRRGGPDGERPRGN